MNRFAFEFRGEMPILFHADDIDQGDDLKAWRSDPANRNLSVPGDDRSPPWTWQTYLYSDGEHLACPSEVISAALRFAGSKMKIGKGNASYKSLSQSGILVEDEYCLFRTAGKQIRMADILAFRSEPFAVHVEKARALGFTLFKKRAKPPGSKSKHIRVRARFDEWTVNGTCMILEPSITPDVLKKLFEMAGSLAGLMDWRPSSKDSPGPYGRAAVTLKAIK